MKPMLVVLCRQLGQTALFLAAAGVLALGVLRLR